MYPIFVIICVKIQFPSTYIYNNKYSNSFIFYLYAHTLADTFVQNYVIKY